MLEGKAVPAALLCLDFSISIAVILKWWIVFLLNVCVLGICDGTVNQ